MDRGKKRPQRVQPIWSLNRAVTNSSDNPVSGANTGPECLKVNGDPPGPVWQIVLRSVCLPTNFHLSKNLASVLRDCWINTTIRRLVLKNTWIHQKIIKISMAAFYFSAELVSVAVQLFFYKYKCFNGRVSFLRSCLVFNGKFDTQSHNSLSLL